MAGLVVLGVLTVIAGVLSGHSTVDYVLGRDAQEAVLSWAAEIDTKLDKSDAPRHVLDKDIQILDASPFQQNLTSISGKPAGLPANQGFSRGGFGLVEVLDRMTGGWALGHSRQPKDDFVSKLDGFAVLDPNETPIATAGNLSADKLATLLTQDKVREALTTSTRENAVDVASTDEAGDTRVAFGPVTQDGKIARIYAFSLDQSAAALTNVALTVATLMASLFIVLGFSVPAAIASRRIRERWLAEDQIRHLALHDSLTGLPNRLQFHQHLDRAVARAKRHGQLMAVFGLDLDRFKDVNDTLGHATGDALLEEVAARRKSVRESDLVGRLGGDEFAIVGEDINAPEDAMPLARRVCTALGESYHVNGHELTISASIGIALGPVTASRPMRCSRTPTSRSIAPRKTGATRSASSSPPWTRPCRSAAGSRPISGPRCARTSSISTTSRNSISRPAGSPATRPGALVAPDRGRDFAHHLHSDRRGDRPHRAARRMDPANGV
jgi:diguanylate cyclase (GGDEF)-like protein